jgi:hypothetical protein
LSNRARCWVQGVGLERDLFSPSGAALEQRIFRVPVEIGEHGVARCAHAGLPSALMLASSWKRRDGRAIAVLRLMTLAFLAASRAPSALICGQNDSRDLVLMATATAAFAAASNPLGFDDRNSPATHGYGDATFHSNPQHQNGLA